MTLKRGKVSLQDNYSPVEKALNTKPVMLAMSTPMPHTMWMPPRVVAALTKWLFLLFAIASLYIWMM